MKKVAFLTTTRGIKQSANLWNHFVFSMELGKECYGGFLSKVYWNFTVGLQKCGYSDCFCLIRLKAPGSTSLKCLIAPYIFSRI